MTNDENGLNQARAAQKRAEEMLSKVEAQQPEVIDIRDRAVTQRTQNKFGQAVLYAFGRRAS